MYPPEVIHAVRETLRTVYWYKDDLRRFFLACTLPESIVTKQAWHDPQEYKVRIAGKVIDELISMGDDGIGPMRRLIQAILDLPNFDHLRVLDDGAAKVSAARKSVEALRQLVKQHDSSFREDRAAQAAHDTKIAEAVKRRNDEIERLNAHFGKLVAEGDEQRRGILFERFLLDFFSAHDLNPRGSFKIAGEQVDGAFEFEGTQFLMEAKWVKIPLGVASLDSFSRKVARRLENTLGLFIALNGFSKEGLAAFGHSRPSIVLMDGQDLAVVLQGFVDFRDLLKRKIRHAAQTGDPFLRALAPG